MSDGPVIHLPTETPKLKTIVNSNPDLPLVNLYASYDKFHSNADMVRSPISAPNSYRDHFSNSLLGEC